MTKHVLDIGNCGFDHHNLKSMIEKNFDANVLAADSWADASTLMKNGPIDLVIVNRLLDVDHSPGLEIIKTIKADERLKQTPVLLLSNLSDAQAEAEQHGAEPGFGKKQVGDPSAVEKLKPFLTS